MKKRRVLAGMMALTMALSLAGCGGGSSSSGSNSGSAESTATATAAANKDKPLCWFNRQPSNSSTGELDKDALTGPDGSRLHQSKR